MDVSGEPYRHLAADYPAQQYVITFVSHIPSPSLLIRRLLLSIAGGQMREGSMLNAKHDSWEPAYEAESNAEAPRFPNVGQNSPTA